MKYIKVFTDFIENLECLEDDEIGRLFKAMLEYGKDCTQPSLPGNERFLWATARKQIDVLRKSYDHQCEVNRKNRNESSRIVTKSDESSQDKDKDKDKEKEKKVVKRFTPPTYQEVKDYCSEAGLTNVDPNKFVDFYSSKNWMVGKSKMVSWQAACRNWNRSDSRKGTGKNSNYDQRTVTDEDFSDLFLPLG